MSLSSVAVGMRLAMQDMAFVRYLLEPQPRMTSVLVGQKMPQHV